MNFLNTFLVAFPLFVLSNFAIAEVPPPAKLTDVKVSPTCLAVEPSYLPHQPNGFGTGSNGPAVQIKNNCTLPITLTNIQTSTIKAGKATPAKEFLVSTVRFVDGVAVYRDYIYANTEDNCRSADLKVEKIRTDKKAREELRRQSPPDDYKELSFEKEFREANPSRSEETLSACKRLTLTVGQSIEIPTPWNTSYAISGHTMGQDGSKLKDEVFIAGKMIDPREEK